MQPASLFLIGYYVEPVADAIGSEVILVGFRLLETAAALAVAFGLFVLMQRRSQKLSQTP
jgi:hypothetical protein